MIGTYNVITLCGSTRFKDAFLEAQKRLTLEGNIVISVGLFGDSGDAEVWENMDEGTLTKTKEILDDIELVSFRKIIKHSVSTFDGFYDYEDIITYEFLCTDIDIEEKYPEYFNLLLTRISQKFH